MSLSSPNSSVTNNLQRLTLITVATPTLVLVGVAKLILMTTPIGSLIVPTLSLSGGNALLRSTLTYKGLGFRLETLMLLRVLDVYYVSYDS